MKKINVFNIFLFNFTYYHCLRVCLPQVIHGPSLLQYVPCGSIWTFSFLPPPSCTCVPSPWTVTWPSATLSDTIGQTHAPEPGPRSLRSGPSLRVTYAIILTLQCSSSGGLMSHESNLMYSRDGVVSLTESENESYCFEMSLSVY